MSTPVDQYDPRKLLKAVRKREDASRAVKELRTVSDDAEAKYQKALSAAGNAAGEVYKQLEHAPGGKAVVGTRLYRRHENGFIVDEEVAVLEGAKP